LINDPEVKKYLKYLSLGVEIAAGLCVPILLGLWIDSVWETEPWFLIAGVLIGIATLFGIIFRVVKNTGSSN
jgi:F0F1-type ATP synthase assembly protein I